MHEKIKSSIYGFIIGDILGVPVEFYKRSYLKENPITDMVNNRHRGTTIGFYSDDSAMTLCTMKGIIDNPNVFDSRLHKSIMDNLKRNNIPAVPYLANIAIFLDISIDELIGLTDQIRKNR